MEISCIVFDLDGTLLDTLDDIADAMNYSLKQNGFLPYPVNDYKYFVGNGVDILTNRVLDKYNYNEADFLSVKDLYIKKYEEIQKNKTKPYDGILDLINNLKEKGFKLAVLSNKPHKDTLEVIDYYFKLDTFDIVYGQREGVEPKPNPRGLYDILNNLSLNIKEVLYIGDTSVDIQTAARAGVNSVGVLWGFRTEEELRENGATHIVKSPHQILDLVLKHN